MKNMKGTIFTLPISTDFVTKFLCVDNYKRKYIK